MHGSAQSVESTTHLFKGTVFAAGLYGRTGTKMSLVLPILFPFLTSQHVVLSSPMMRKMTATQALMSQTAAGQCLTLLSCPPTPQLIDHCPLWLWGKTRGLGPPAFTRMTFSREGRVRKIWAWRLKKLGLRHCWSLASSVECDHAMEI